MIFLVILLVSAVLALGISFYWGNLQQQRNEELSAQANADAMQLLLRHVNHRISAYLKSVYPNARWEWTTGNPTALVMQGGTGVSACMALRNMTMQTFKSTATATSPAIS